MTKTLLTSILAILLLVCVSCDKNDDSIKSDEDYLLGNWVAKKFKSYHYLNGNLAGREEITYDKKTCYKLRFESNGSVSYDNQSFAKVLNGNWTLNDKTLTTDLSSSSEYGIRYHFPENEIIELSENQLTLKSPFSIEDLGENEYIYYHEIYFEK